MDTAILRSRILDLAIHGQLLPQNSADGSVLDLLAAISQSRGQKITPATDDVPFDLPESWCWVRLGDVLRKMKTRRPSGENFLYVDIDAIDNKRCVIKSPKLIPTTQAPSRASRYTQKGDVLFSMVRPYLRNIAIVDDDDYIASTGFYVCSPIMVDSHYMYQFLTSNYLVSGVNQFMRGDNSPSINSNHLEEFLFPLPPLAEQHRIVEKVEELLAAVDKIESAQSDIASAASILQSRILDLAFSGKLTDSNISTWKNLTLGDVCSFQNGYAFDSHDYVSNGTPLIRIGDIKNGEVTFDNCVFIQQVVDDRFVVKKGDLLIAMSGASTGKIGNYFKEEVAYLNQRVGNIRVKDESLLLPIYRDYFMRSQMDVIYKMAYGGAQPNISGKMILSIPILLPPLAEQRRIVAKVESLFAAIDKLK